MRKTKTKIFFDSCGESGNIYHILGKVSEVLRKEHRLLEFNEVRDKVFASGSYKDALAIIRQHIDLIDNSNKE